MHAKREIMISKVWHNFLNTSFFGSKNSIIWQITGGKKT